MQDIAFSDVIEEYKAMGITDVIFSTHFTNGVPMWRMGLGFQVHQRCGIIRHVFIDSRPILYSGVQGYSRLHQINFLVSNGALASTITQVSIKGVTLLPFLTII